jgi:lysozyme
LQDSLRTITVNKDKLIASLIKHEGEILHAYQDSQGFWTIGCGRCIDRRVGGGISRTESRLLLGADITTAIARMGGQYPWFDDLDEVRQRVMAEMMFNLGPGRLGEFHRLLSAMHDREYEAAAREMMDSTWATQVGVRSTHLAEMMRAGKDHGE